MESVEELLLAMQIQCVWLRKKGSLRGDEQLPVCCGNAAFLFHWWPPNLSPFCQLGVKHMSMQMRMATYFGTLRLCLRRHNSLSFHSHWCSTCLSSSSISTTSGCRLHLLHFSKSSLGPSMCSQVEFGLISWSEFVAFDWDLSAFSISLGQCTHSVIADSQSKWAPLWINVAALRSIDGL